MAVWSWTTRVVWLAIIWHLVLHYPSYLFFLPPKWNAERTFLAWLRTSLAFASIGIAITQLFRLNTTIQEREGGTPVNPGNTFHLRQVGKPLGATFLGIAIVVLLVGGRRYFESQVRSTVIPESGNLLHKLHRSTNGRFNPKFRTRILDPRALG